MFQVGSSSNDENEPLIYSSVSAPISNQSNYNIITENELDVNMENTVGKYRRLPQYIAALAATTGALAAGVVLGWSSPAEDYIVRRKAYGFSVSDEQYSWIASISTLGGVVSCILSGLVMDKIGRKNTMLILLFPFSIGWCLVIWPFSVYVLYFGRLLCGFAAGAFFVVVPAYTGEIATKDIRGTLGSLLQLMITLGILLVYILGYFFTLKTFNVICALLPLLFGTIFILMPESPYYYIMRNNINQAEKSLRWLRGTTEISHELSQIQLENDFTAQNTISIMTKLRQKPVKRGLFIMLILLFLTQLSGINAVIFYTEWIFKTAKNGIESNLSTMIVGAMQVIATFSASCTVDKLGRRCLLITSAFIMCICNISLGFYFFLDDHKSNIIDHLQWVPVISLCLYIIAFSFGLGPIPWILVGELFSTDCKAFASSISGATSWLIAFFVTKCFANTRKLIGVSNTFFVFAIFAACAAVFIAKILPETNGLPFAEIQRRLQNDNIPENVNET